MKKLKTPQDVKRREFLKTIASSGISAHTLKAMPLGLGLLASRAVHWGASGIKRILFFYIPDGAPPNTYTFKNGLLGPTAAPLEDVKDNIIIFDKLTRPTGKAIPKWWNC